MRVVITHDFAETYGGAERVTREMAEEFPDAPVWMLLGRPAVARRMAIADRWHSVLPPRARLLSGYRWLTPALPRLASHARLPEADVLLSSSYAFAHHFHTANRAPHVCYCHSPLRFAWSMTAEYKRTWAGGRLAGAGFDLLARQMRREDRRAAERVDRFLTQSPYVGERIRACYQRESTPIGAPIDCDTFKPSPDPEAGDFFLLCARLVEPYKQVMTTLDAFRRIPDARLVIAGDGPAMGGLRAAAPPNASFLGHLDDDDLVPLMQGCRAVVFPSKDDFGLIPLEAMACGRPVIAYDGGGARHTVVANVTGRLFAAQTPEAIAAEVRAFDPGAYDPAVIRAHAKNWDRHRFRARLREAVERAAGGQATAADRTPAHRRPVGAGALRAGPAARPGGYDGP